jgi:hypothetical protein
LIFIRKTGAGEGIRTLDPNLGKIQLDEILFLDQMSIRFLKNPNTIRIFQAQYASKLWVRFRGKWGAAALYPKLAMDANLLRTRKSLIKLIGNRST